MEAQMQSVQASLALLLKHNKEMSEKITALEVENREIKKNAGNVQERIQENKEKWEEMNKEAVELFQRMTMAQEDLAKDNVEEEYIQKTSAETLLACTRLMGNCGGEMANESIKVKQEPIQREVLGTPYEAVGKEERIDLSFGHDGDYSAVSMRRFIERYKVVKELNMRARLRGWDSPSYRAGKLTLCLQGEAFDYVSFASSMLSPWTNDDELLVSKLKEKFTNVQAIELNILGFEKSIQEPRETISDYMTRLQMTVKEAYDGDSQSDLDRRVAWKFVSGLRDERIKRKLLEGGWMKSRQEAKPLEDLLKIADIAKKTDDAVKAMGKETGSINAAHEYSVSAWEQKSSSYATDRRKRSSGESGQSNRSNSSRGSGESSDGLPLDFLECYYCKKKHRGGWFHCSVRKKEDPTWRPARRGDKAGRGKGTDFR